MNTDTTTQKQILFIVFFTTFLELLGMSVAIPIFAPLLFDTTHALGANIAESSKHILYGLLIASYPFAQFFGTPILGALSDRFGRKPLILLSRFGTLVSYILVAYAISIGSLPLLFFARLFDGFTGGNISVAQSAIADISAPQDRSKNFGFIGMAFGLGFIVGPAMGGILSDPSIVSWFSYATPFWVASVVTVFNLFLVQIKLPETLVHRQNHAIHPFSGMSSIVKSLQNPSLRVIFIVFFLYTLGFNFFTQFFQVYLVTTFQATQKDIGFIFSFIGIWIAVAQRCTNRWFSKRYAPDKILRVSLLLLGLTLPLLVLPTHMLYLYAILPFVANFSGLSMPNSTAVVSNCVAPEKQGEILGISQSFQAAGMAIPPVIAGFLSVIDARLPIVTAGTLIVIAWIVFVALFRYPAK